MSKKNYYAVSVGREIGIFETWAACAKQVLGYPQSQYRGFAGYREAKNWLIEARNRKGRGKPPKSGLMDPVSSREQRQRRGNTKTTETSSQIATVFYEGQIPPWDARLGDFKYLTAPDQIRSTVFAALNNPEKTASTP